MLELVIEKLKNYKNYLTTLGTESTTHQFQSYNFDHWHLLLQYHAFVGIDDWTQL